MKLPTKMFKKLLLSTLLAAYLFFNFSVPYAHAQWYNQSFPDWYAQVYNPDIPPSEIFGERYTAAQTQWVLYSLIAIILNKLAETAAGEDFGKGVINTVTGKDIGDLFSQAPNSQEPKYATPINSPPSLLSQVFQDRSLSSFTYFKYKLQGAHLIPQAHAQTGFGFEALSPVQGIWLVSRDIAYSLFILISIALAFMIMFRVRLSAKTVVTIQSAIPKITIALILVTFSYAIAGFMVDLMYVTIGLISLLLGQSADGAAKIFDIITRGVPMPYLGIRGIIGTSLWFLAAGIAILINFLLNGVHDGSLTSLAFGLIGILLINIFAVAIIYLTIRAFMLVIKTFVTILILTILGPIQITAGILYPDIGFGAWLKKFISTLAIFPVIGLLYLLGVLFALGAISTLGDDTNVAHWLGLETVREMVPENLRDAFNASGYAPGSNWPPFIDLEFASSADAVMAFVFICATFMLLAMIPKAEQFISAALQGRGFALGTAFGEARTGGSEYAGQIRQVTTAPPRAVKKGATAIHRFRTRGGGGGSSGSSSGASAVP